MSKNRKKSRDEEIWSKRFDENYNEIEYVSRSQRSKNSKNDGSEMSPMLAGTVIFLAALILAIIVYYSWFSNRPHDEATGFDESEIETVENQDIDSENEKEPEVETESEEETESESEPESETQIENEPELEVETEPETQVETEPEQQVETEPEPESTPVQGRTTYTVKSGDNMYRIALNHGMTTSELMALNNLTNETVYVGQELIVE